MLYSLFLLQSLLLFLIFWKQNFYFALTGYVISGFKMSVLARILVWSIMYWIKYVFHSTTKERLQKSGYPKGPSKLCRLITAILLQICLLNLLLFIQSILPNYNGQIHICQWTMKCVSWIRSVAVGSLH